MRHIQLDKDTRVLIPKHAEAERNISRHLESVGKILGTTILSLASLAEELRRVTPEEPKKWASLEREAKEFHERIVRAHVRVRRGFWYVKANGRRLSQHMHQHAVEVILMLYGSVDPVILERATRDIREGRQPHLLSKVELAKRTGLSVEDIDGMDQKTYQMWATVMTASDVIAEERIDDMRKEALADGRR